METLPVFSIRSKQDKNGLYHLRNQDIERYSIRQLLEYRKDYFDEIRKIDAEDFCRFATGNDVLYRSLKHFEDKPLGLVMFASQHNKIVVVDKEACHYQESRIRFTILHEIWHYQFDDSVLAIDTLKDISPAKEKQLREHYANQYAASLLMPRIFVNRIFKEYKKHYLVKDNEKAFHFECFIHKVASDLGVSFSAAKNRANSLKIDF